jgi:hypothetical protein
MWLMPLLSVMIMAGCCNRAGITSPGAFTLPTVMSTNPVNAETDVILSRPIDATVSKTMDGATMTTATFALMQGSTLIRGTVSYAGKITTFTPDSVFTPKTVYTAMLTTGVKDPAGNALAGNYVWSFTTGELVDDFRPW